MGALYKYTDMVMIIQVEIMKKNDAIASKIQKGYQKKSQT